MTEKHAWLYLAQVWDLGATEIGNVVRAFFPNGQFATGLCYSVWCLSQRVPAAAIESMSNKIPDCGTKYLFPTTLSGAKERVRFCLERAEELR